MTTRFRWIALVGLLAFVAGGRSGHAQGQRDGHFNGLHFTGVINDFTTPALGSWEVHGVWSLDMVGGPDAANFSAALTMERSDLFFAATPGADANNLAMRNAHTHHLSLSHGTVTPIPGGFRITGPAHETMVTLNGGSTPFEPDPPTSTLQIDITGGNLVAFSNITVTFGGAAVKHFGTNPFAGLVKSVK
jgi:hypothetical protein